MAIRLLPLSPAARASPGTTSTPPPAPPPAHLALLGADGAVAGGGGHVILFLPHIVAGVASGIEGLQARAAVGGQDGGIRQLQGWGWVGGKRQRHGGEHNRALFSSRARHTTEGWRRARTVCTSHLSLAARPAGAAGLGCRHRKSVSNSSLQGAGTQLHEGRGGPEPRPCCAWHGQAAQSRWLLTATPARQAARTGPTEERHSLPLRPVLFCHVRHRRIWDTLLQLLQPGSQVDRLPRNALDLRNGTGVWVGGRRGSRQPRRQAGSWRAARAGPRCVCAGAAARTRGPSSAHSSAVGGKLV